MDKFSKFFPNDEVRQVIVNRESKYLYIWYLLELVAIFFFLFPLWHLGHYGVLLWLTVLIACLIFFANYLLRRNTIYIVTKYKIWHVFYVNDNNIKLRGAINISEIESITKTDNDLHIKTNSAVHIMKNLKNADYLTSLLTAQDLSKNEKSGII
jgi:hypothetical protein